jgi:hypothetical protein
MVRSLVQSEPKLSHCLAFNSPPVTVDTDLEKIERFVTFKASYKKYNNHKLLSGLALCLFLADASLASLALHSFFLLLYKISQKKNQRSHLWSSLVL